MALRIATKYASDSILDFIHLDNNYSIYELKVPKDWFGKSLSQIDIRKKFKINILTIKRGEEVFIPSPDTVIKTVFIYKTPYPTDIFSSGKREF